MSSQTLVPLQPKIINISCGEMYYHLPPPQTGDPAYSHLFGHATLQEGIPPLCKTYIKFEDCGVWVRYMDKEYESFLGYNPADFPPCKYGYTWQQEPPTFFDSNFPHSYECLGWGEADPPTPSEMASGIHERTKEIKLIKNCYPSVTKDYINIELFQVNDNLKEIEILELNGTKKEEFLFKKNELSYKLDVTEYAAGVYFIRVTDKVSGESDIMKFIKQ